MSGRSRPDRAAQYSKLSFSSGAASVTPGSFQAEQSALPTMVGDCPVLPSRRAGTGFWRVCAPCHCHGTCQNLMRVESERRRERDFPVMGPETACASAAPGLNHKLSYVLQNPGRARRAGTVGRRDMRIEGRPCPSLRTRTGDGRVSRHAPRAGYKARNAGGFLYRSLLLVGCSPEVRPSIRQRIAG